MQNRKLHFYIPLSVALISCVAVIIGLFNLWFGVPRSETMWFCERVRDGFVKQPANTWSNIGFMLTGVYIGWISYKNRFTENNLMTESFLYPVMFASIVAFLGPGSMAMHGSNGPWGGFMDLLSMFMISSFVFGYALKRLLNLSNVAFVLLFLMMIIFSSYVNLSPDLNSSTPFITLSEYIFAGQLIFSAPLELAIRSRLNTGSKVIRGVGAIVTMVIAFVIWNLSRTSESWFCEPDSLIQGHAIWHILNALSAYLLFMYYVSEEDRRVVNPSSR